MPLQGKSARVTGSSRGIGRGIALKLAERGVNVAVHYYTQAEAAKETLAQVQARGAKGCMIQADVTRPDEINRMFVGNAVTLLCMDEAGFITGQTIQVDGGASVMDPVFPLAIQRG